MQAQLRPENISGIGSGFDPLSPEVRRCPHPHYAALNRAPVQPVAGHPNFYLVSSYDTVSEVLMDPETYDGQPFPGYEVNIMSAMRPEPHKRLRGAIQSLFTNQSLTQLTPHIEAQVRRRTAELLAAGQGDLMALWANPIPLSVIARLFGFPEGEADLARLHRYGDAAIRLVIPLGGPGLPVPRGLVARWRQALGLLTALPPLLRLLWQLPAAERKALSQLPNPMADLPGYPRTGFPHHPELARLILEFQLEVLGILHDHLRNPRDEVVDALLPPYRRGELRLGEILSSALQILVAGYETTANTLGAAVHRFSTEPERLRELQDHPERIEAYVEELLRLDAPLQRTLRRTTRPVRLAGVDLPENAQLILMLGAANLDATRFDCPEQFDPARGNARRHLAFGRGIHMCIGAQLARLEARLALAELVPRLQAVELLPEDPPQRVTDKDIGMWGYTRLPVRLTPRSVT
ncbi:MAG: cytochrome P450 [Nevskiaceae bacterium]|nr:MAG: cytochrome P450 [Nevskiaceae bacterium]TAM22274.1 MAG: cytochrome P450 [Nevskiaceae bacterium]